MNAAIVKIDVAAATLGWNVRRLQALVDGATLEDKAFVWVFNFATDRGGERQDLRWWLQEIVARKDNGRGYDYYELPWVIDRILPVKRLNFMPDELDEMFQLRRNTRPRFHAEMERIALELKLCWAAKPVGNFYPRRLIASFLERRWLGALYERGQKSAVRSQTPAPSSGLRSATSV